MKKTLKYISLLTALLVGFTGCVKEQWEIEKNNGEELPYPSDGKALIKFTVAVPGGYASTKANLADTPTIENMQVVVFGSSGFLKECADIETFQKATTNGNTTLYTYQAKISITDSKNLKVHIIANLGDVKLPWKYDTEVMTKYAYTSNNQDAYWASFILPNGVTLKKEWDANTQSMVYVKDGDYYQVTDDVTDAFCGGTGRPGLPLVRNFAKISIQSTTPQFVLEFEFGTAFYEGPAGVGDGDTSVAVGEVGKAGDGLVLGDITGTTRGTCCTCGFCTGLGNVGYTDVIAEVTEDGVRAFFVLEVYLIVAGNAVGEVQICARSSPFVGFPCIWLSVIKILFLERIEGAVNNHVRNGFAGSGNRPFIHVDGAHNLFSISGTGAPSYGCSVGVCIYILCP